MGETGRRDKGKEEMFKINVQRTMVFNDLIVKAVGVAPLLGDYL